MTDLLKVTGLKKSYGRFSLDVSFTVPDSCIVGFIGVNGAGKTTTIRSILGLAKKDSGCVQLFGADADRQGSELRDRVGVVLDDGCFYDELTIAQMKQVIAPAYSHWDESDFRKYMNRFSLDLKQKIRTLSKGMRMKYALVLALSHHAELLIMDEPTSGLDPLIRSELLTILKEYMNEGGRGVFFSTHITSDLDKTADMLVMVDGGRIVFEEEKDTLLERYRLVKGDVKSLDAAAQKLFQHIEITPFGFTGLTCQLDEVRKAIPGLIAERPSIEDIMLGNIREGGKQ